MRKGDVGTVLRFTILDEDGGAVNLTTVASVTLVMKMKSTRVERACTVVDPDGGIVSYTVATGDPSVTKSGTLKMDLCLVFVDGRTFTSDMSQEVVELVL